jgi:hypothetical protein
MGLIANALTRLATSHFNYWLGFMVDAAVAVTFWMFALRYVRGTWATCISVVLAGLSLYGLMEYLFHRWIYHGERTPAATGHLMHHEDPHALIGLPFFFPATVGFVLWFLLRRILGEGWASLMMAAVATNFLYYGLLHHTYHHGRWKAGYFQRMRRYHLIHHHFPDRNFGLTMTLWDWVFGTHYLSGKRSRAGGFRTGGKHELAHGSMPIARIAAVNVSAAGFQESEMRRPSAGTHWGKSPRQTRGRAEDPGRKRVFVDFVARRRGQLGNPSAVRQKEPRCVEDQPPPGSPAQPRRVVPTIRQPREGIWNPKPHRGGQRQGRRGSNVDKFR